MFPAHRGMGAISPEGCMNDWPEGWYRKERLRPHGWGGAGNAPDDLTARYPGGRTRRYPPGSAGNWPEQPPLRSAPGRAAPGRGAPPRPPGDWGLQPRRRGIRPKRVAQGIAVLVVLIIVAGAGFYFYLNSKLTRISALSGYQGRPAPGAGQNWLITGSDSRQGLTGQQLNQLSLGHGIAGHRSDTIMVLHIPANGTRPVLVSIPATPTCRSPVTETVRSTPRTTSAVPRCSHRPCRTSPACTSATTWASGSAASSAWSTTWAA